MLFARLARPPSLRAASLLVGGLVAGSVLLTFGLVMVTARALRQSAEPAEAIARVRHEAYTSAIRDREAILAAPELARGLRAEALAAQARVALAIEELRRSDSFDGEELAAVEALARSWAQRRNVGHDLFDDPPPPVEMDPRMRADVEELARSTLGVNDALQRLSDAAQARTRRTAATLELAAVLVAAAALFAVGLGAVTARGLLVRPLLRILTAETSVAHGRLDVRVSTNGLAEVRALALGFNEMVSSLRSRADEVRQKQSLLGRRERALHHRNRELAAANAELDAFAYAASHDLRAPLRSIESMARFLWEDVGDKLDPESRDKLDRIRRASRRLHQLIDSLLEVARAGRDLGALEEVSLERCFEDACDALAAPIREAAAHVEPEGPMPSLWGDHARLVQVLQNLIGNAIKYARPGVPARVHVGARLEDEGTVVALYVRDEGIGIPEDQHQRIFQLFRRLHREADFEGAGVGLSIVQRIARAHGGEVSVDSAPGRGSCFTVRLPRRPRVVRKEAA